ncbi:MAG TPA: hypothetical protein DCR43_06230 [Bacteroidales bacterium]|nr:MAG: hypothetical protein A2X11_11770 [Bacteroidetes bacterium GWE2_42_24]OFY28256.1 MAG: hypothetical protein A2X09_11920 [Bacteroidetes bacterium GWF2_43_11]HAQ65432.1 hypothetical protein [Bacteroidales bacterium]HBZ66985.1 hypothetical protein [Bacteroidales bacterium]
MFAEKKGGCVLFFYDCNGKIGNTVGNDGGRRLLSFGKLFYAIGDKGIEGFDTDGPLAEKVGFSFNTFDQCFGEAKQLTLVTTGIRRITCRCYGQVLLSFSGISGLVMIQSASQSRRWSKVLKMEIGGTEPGVLLNRQSDFINRKGNFSGTAETDNT